MYVHHLHGWYPWRSGEGSGSRATGAAGVYEPHMGVETKARSSTGAASALTQSPFSIPLTLSIVY